MPISAVDSIPIAFRHTSEQIFKPFRFGQWNRLALVGLLAGELGGGGLRSVSNFTNRHHGGLGGMRIDPAALAAVIAVLVASGLVLGLIFMYVGSVMRFILFDSVLAKECHIRLGWNRRQSEGMKYFLFKLAYAVISFFVLAVLVGIPVAFAFTSGWFREPKAHLAPLILGGLLIFFLLFIFVVASAVVLVLTKDFVVPQMALEGIGVVESWRRLWAMMQTEAGSYAAYIGMKIALSIGAGIIVGIATAIMALIIALPAVFLGVLAVITGKSAGLTWDAYTITLAIVVGCILFAGFFYLVSLLSVPVIVFFPAYSIYFFAGRYPRLAAALYPASAVPSPVPPARLIPPNPEPIG